MFVIVPFSGTASVIPVVSKQNALSNSPNYSTIQNEIFTNTKGSPKLNCTRVFFYLGKG